MMSDVPQSIPASVIRRLTAYLTRAQTLCAAGVEWVSSQELAEDLGLTSSTVRQDLTHLDFCGISRRGYQVAGLQAVLSRVLGGDTVWNMAVVGAGNIGKALALHREFSRRGFTICGLFDSDPKKIGKKVGGLTIQSIQALGPLARTRRVDIGVIAVPSAAAQSVADILVAARVRGLLNLTHVHLAAPRSVPVVEVRIVASLQELAHAISLVPCRPAR